ncbi:uncharacterized protein [Argopecten irradians]|uniref:uncharacterized protein n=1 Tax=Argopecten irradians TaxID=31199 RepID=UPI00371E34A0
MWEAWSVIVVILSITGECLVYAEICYTSYDLNYHSRYTVECEHGCCGYYYYRACCTDSNVPLVIGCVVGGICFLIGIGFLICVCVYCNKKPHKVVHPSRPGHDYPVYRQSVPMLVFATPTHMTSFPTEPPPAYSIAGPSTNFDHPSSKT